MRVLVTGGTGVLGREIVSGPLAAGFMRRVLTRRTRPSTVSSETEWAQADLLTGDGLAEALADVHTIIHAASDSRNSVAVDVDGTRRLVEAAAIAGVRHFIYVSIVGIDRIPFSYYRNKLAAEAIVERGRVPWSVLRATQFHSLVDSVLRQLARVPLVMPVPTRFLIQSVDEADVARRLMRCVADGPCGRLTDYVGPERMTLGDAARTWVSVRGLTHPVINLPLPGAMAAALREGLNTNPAGEAGSATWRDWLVARGAPSAALSAPR